MVWVDKRYLWLVNGCLECHRPIRTNTCPPKRFQKSLHPKLVPILSRVSEVVAWKTAVFSSLLAAEDVSQRGTSATRRQKLHTHFSLSPPRLTFLAWSDFHTHSSFARSTIPEEKWELLVVYSANRELSNYDDDHNDDFKTTIGLMIKTTALQGHYAF